MAQGNFAGAEPLLRRSLAIDEKVYGPDHLEVAADLNNCAGVLFNQVSENRAAFTGRLFQPQGIQSS